MAVYVVSAAGDGTSGSATTTNPSAGEWATAYATLGAAIAVATTTGDTIIVDVDHAETITAGYTIGATDIRILVMDKDNSNALTKMGEARGAITDNNTSLTLFALGTEKLYVHGLTLKLTGASARSMTLFNGANSQVYTDDVTLWNASTSSTSSTAVYSSADQSGNCQMYGFTDRRDNAAHLFTGAGNVVFRGGKISASSALVTSCCTPSQTDTGSFGWEFHGFDFSAAATTAYLVGAWVQYANKVTFIGCKLPTSYVGLNQTLASFADHEVFIYNCIAGTTRNIFGYWNGLGSVTTDDAIYVSAGAAARSWKITTASGVSARNPFRTPWINLYNTVNTEISPYFDVLRNNDSTTAYNDDETWAEFAYNATSGSELASFVNDGMASIIATPAAQATSALADGDWAANSGSCWYGKLGATLTAAEDGYIRGRVCVAVVTAGKFHVDPQIRT